MSSKIPCKERWYDGFSVGESFLLASVKMIEHDMIAFATQFDPQLFRSTKKLTPSA